MMERILVINPSSTRWWLISLSPLIFYDRIYITQKTIDKILNQGDRSSFHERAAKTLELILSNTTENIIFIDNRILSESQLNKSNRASIEFARHIIEESTNYSYRNPTLVKPSELKRILLLAYRNWIYFNYQKESILTKNEILHNVLLKDIIPHSSNNLKKIINTPSREIPDLLHNNAELNTTFIELIRNSLLIMDVAQDSSWRVYDGLIEQYLPTIELLERIRVFKELPNQAIGLLDINLLAELYSFRLKKMKREYDEKPSVFQSLFSALKDRKKLLAIRNKIAEFDDFISDNDFSEKAEISEICAFIKNINKKINEIEAICTWAVWGSGAYLFSEIVSSFAAPIRHLFKAGLFNPLTIKTAKEFIKNYYILSSGLKSKTGFYLSIIRDRCGNIQKPDFEKKYRIRPDVFKFWGGYVPRI